VAGDGRSHPLSPRRSCPRESPDLDRPHRWPSTAAAS
jgi:hypothetical protein